MRRGFYAQWLRRYLDYFPADQLLVLQFERCVSDPSGQLEATYRYLGLPEHLPRQLHQPVNPSGRKRVLDEDVVDRLVDLYAADVAALVALIPSVDLSYWPHFSSLGQ